MRLFLTKLLLRLLGDPVGQIKEKLVNDWLIGLSDEDRSGYKGYYTIRKKAIYNALVAGLKEKEYWFYLGRLAELKQMNTMSNNLIKKYATNKKRDEG